MQLRDYQQKAIEDVRSSYRAGHRATLLVSPTGSGKTNIFSYIAKGMQQNNKRIVILAHRQELLKQISRTLRTWDADHGLLMGGAKGLSRKPILVASVFTFIRRMDHYIKPDLIIVDEAHHATVGSAWGKVIQWADTARILGVTATPQRLDGKGLADLFQHIVLGPSVSSLTARGFLSPAEVYAPAVPDLSHVRRRGGDFLLEELAQIMDQPKLIGSAVTYYQKLLNGKRAVAFCVSVQHACDVVSQFQAAGIAAAHVDGGMRDGERGKILQDFEKGDIKILASCDLISEGFDLPAIEGAILLRPTESLALYLQQVGRAIRPSPGKKTTVILDHAGNTARHGFIDEEREWTLHGATERRKSDEEREPRVATCPKCFASHKPAPRCPRCGHVYLLQGRSVAEANGELVLVNAAPDAGREVDSNAKFMILVNVARKRNYSNPEGWARRVLESQEAARLAKLRDIPSGSINGLTSDERIVI